MKWAIQSENPVNWYHDEWAKSAIKLGRDVSPVWTLFDDHDLQEACEFELKRDTIFFGSAKLIDRVYKHPMKFKEGVFFNENFNYRWFIENNGELMLNGGNNSTDLSVNEITHDLIKLIGPTFVRPINDLKSFVGGLVTPDNYAEWSDSLIRQYGIDKYSQIRVLSSTPKPISAEYRCFVVADFKPTVMQYQDENKLCAKEISVKLQLDIESFLKDVTMPHEICVVDVCLSEGEFRVVEFNCFNASGTYGHDTNIIVKQLIDNL